MPPPADATDAAHAHAGEPARRFCAHCGAHAPEPGHDCRRPVIIGALAHASAHRVWDDLVAVRGSLILYFSIIAASILGVVATAADLTTSADAEVAADVGAGIAVSIVILIASVASRDRLRPVLSTIGPGRWYFIAPIAALGTFALAQLACASLADLFGMPQIDYSSAYLTAGWGWWLPVLIVCIQPAIFEELAFRGVMTSSLGPVLGPRETLFVVALLFAIIHLNPLGFVHLFVAGLALGVLRSASGSLYPGMLLHFCHNALALLQESGA